MDNNIGHFYTITEWKDLESIRLFAGDNYESDMPAFGAILNDQEIEAILTYIKSTWPEREQVYQQQRTQQANPQ